MKKKIAKLLRRIAATLDPTGYDYTGATYKVMKVKGYSELHSSAQPQRTGDLRTGEAVVNAKLDLLKRLEKYIETTIDNEPIPFGRDLLVASVFVAKKNNHNPKY